MTVSRVINANVNVSEKTRARVVKAIAELNYLPNEVARSLRDQRTRQIGIIVPNLHDPFFAMCSHSISLVAKEHSYSTVITVSNEDPLIEVLEAKRMLRRHIEGLIIIPASGKTQLLDPEFQHTPIVTLDRPIPKSSFDCVLVQNKRGAESGVQHLIARSHRRIVCLGLTRQLWTMKERFEGYRAAMEAAELKPDSYVLAESHDEMLHTIQTLLADRNPPTAFFCSNNLIMRNALHALSALNIEIPRQIALVGFDDFEMADIIKPSVTVVRQPTDVLGRVAAELLFSRLAGSEEIDTPKRIVLPVELIVRDSCGTHYASRAAS